MIEFFITSNGFHFTKLYVKFVVKNVDVFFLFLEYLHENLKVFSWKTNFVISVEFSGLIANIVPLLFCYI